MPRKKSTLADRKEVHERGLPEKRELGTIGTLSKFLRLRRLRQEENMVRANGNYKKVMTKVKEHGLSHWKISMKKKLALLEFLSHPYNRVAPEKNTHSFEIYTKKKSHISHIGQKETITITVTTGVAVEKINEEAITIAITRV
ncbi:MAG: hypothetical protein ABIH20_06400 [Candidatus Diapherotrites archaeon]